MNRLVLSILFAMTLSGCASWPARPPVTAAQQAAAKLPGYDNIRHWADAPASEWLKWRGQFLADRTAAGVVDAPQILAISSGSDKGAFSAGYLNGWTASGKRPRFDIVTGVSTGALIAPFAFLGPDYDRQIADLYTGIDSGDIYHTRVLSGLTGGPSFATSKPLARLIDRNITPEIVDRIAREHAKGRRLLVMTTNLDASRGMVWDMGAIAASGQANRVALFRRILLASASIPGVFPPVLIQVAANGKWFSELHVDGGTTSSIFVLPAALLWDNNVPDLPGGGSVTLLYNGRLDPEYQVVKPKAFNILSRALSTVIGAADRSSIHAYRAFARDHHVELNIRAIGADFTMKDKRLFSPKYMRALYKFGCRDALKNFGMSDRTNACAVPATTDQSPD